MKSSTPENPYRVLLGSSFTLFLGLLLSLPIAYVGIAAYLSVTNQTLPVQVSPAASMWELRLKPERGESYEHEQLEAELKKAFPGASFDLNERGTETWMTVHVREDEVFQDVRTFVATRDYDSGGVRLPHFLDVLQPNSLEVTVAWFGEHPGAVMAAISSQSLSFGFLGVILIILSRRRNFAWAAAPAPLARRIFEGVVGGVALVAAASIVDGLLTAAGRPVVEQPWVTKLLSGSDSSVWALWAVAVVLAPIAEELFFRGYLFQSLDVRISRPLALAVSTAYFAGVHGNPSGLFIYLVLGVGLAYLHLRTRSLVAPILAHSIVNARALGFN